MKLLTGLACCLVIVSVQAQDYGPLVTQGQQTFTDIWTELQQKRTLLDTAQKQNTADTATILTLRNQVAALQAQLAAVPPCPPAVICQICPLPVICPTPPPPPVVVPPPTGPGSAILSWGTVAGATGYRVYYGTASNTYIQPLGQGIQILAPPFTVGNLAVGTRYFFAVTATNATVESVFSNEVFKDIVAAPPPPPPPPMPGPTANCTKLDIKSPVGATLVDSSNATWTVVPSTAADRVANQVEARRNGVASGKGSTNFIQLIGGTVFSFDPPAPAGSGPGWEQCCWVSVPAPTCP